MVLEMYPKFLFQEDSSQCTFSDLLLLPLDRQCTFSYFWKSNPYSVLWSTFTICNSGESHIIWWWWWWAGKYGTMTPIWCMCWSTASDCTLYIVYCILYLYHIGPVRLILRFLADNIFLSPQTTVQFAEYQLVSTLPPKCDYFSGTGWIVFKALKILSHKSYLIVIFVFLFKLFSDCLLPF